MPNPREPATPLLAIATAGNDGRVHIQYDPWNEDAMRQARAHVDQVVDDAVAAWRRKREFVDFRGVQEAHVRLIARSAARFALLMDRNPDREDA